MEVKRGEAQAGSITEDDDNVTGYETFVTNHKSATCKLQRSLTSHIL